MKITVAALADNLGPEDQLLAGALYTVWTDEDGLHSARNIAYLVYNAGDVPLATRQEALYLLVWTNRQLNYLSESMELAQEGIEKYPDDPRFHHGLQLALHLQCRRNMEYPAKIIKQIVQHGDEAIRLYGTIDNREGQATCANNNAYILAARSELKSAVQEARRYLAILNGALPEATWGRRLPEFYDTKAAVLYRYSRYLAERAWKRGGDLAAAIAEAEEAYAAADAAYQLVEKSRYEERRALIKVYLDRLRNGTLL